VVNVGVNKVNLTGAVKTGCAVKTAIYRVHLIVWAAAQYRIEADRARFLPGGLLSDREFADKNRAG
jgi:hypothetical protein